MGNMFSFLAVLLVVGVIQHSGWCSLKGEGFVIALVKIPCSNVNKGKIIIQVMGQIFQVEYWAEHPCVRVHLVYYD